MALAEYENSKQTAEKSGQLTKSNQILQQDDSKMTI
jgi:hypothetical protein